MTVAENDVLVGDIGGTNARLAVATVEGRSWRLEDKRTFRSEEFDGLAAVVRRYRAELDPSIERASFAVACPVVDQRCRLPNLDWQIDRRGLARAIGVEDARLVNDFDAVCHALPTLGPGDLVELQAGSPRRGHPEAVIGAGTGLGQGFVTRHEGERLVHSSEGGHAGFAPRDRTECELLEFVSREYGRASNERVVSGPGLVDIYRFLLETGRAEPTPETRRAMESADPAAVVSRRGLEGRDPACEAALDLFVSAYGAQAGNLALTVQALGGVYVAGGIAPKILEKLEDGAFVEAFCDKGRFAPMMREIPVRVIVEEEVGLIGAAAAVQGGETA